MSNTILQFLLCVHSDIGALGFLNREVLMRMNDRLLKGRQSQDICKLTEVTAELLTRHYGESSKSTESQNISPNFTPMHNTNVNSNNTNVFTIYVY